MASIRINLHSGNYPAKTPANYTPSPIPPGPTPPGPTPTVPKTYTINVTPNADAEISVAYADDAVGMTPMMLRLNDVSYGSWQNAFFMPKPCMLNSDGTVAYYLNPDDYTKKADGTPSDVANPDFDGNAMMEWSLIYYKFSTSSAAGNTNWSFSVSNIQPDESYKCWCNLDAEGNVTPHFYTAIYGSTGSSKFRSLSGIALTTANGCGNTNASQERSRSRANNVTETVEWSNSVYCDFILIYSLLMLVGRTIDVAAVFGQGICNGNDTITYTTGALDTAGLFYGDTHSYTKPVKIFGMENWYGFRWDRLSGLYSYDNKFWTKLTQSTADGTTVNDYPYSVSSSSTTELIAMTNPGMPSNYIGYIMFLWVAERGAIPFMTQTADSFKTSFYASKYIYSSGNHLAMFGGSTATGDELSIGVGWHFGLADNISRSDISTRMSCKPLASRFE